MPSDDRVQQQAISAILAAGVDDWGMLHDVLWHTPPQLEEFDFIDSLGKRRTVAFEELLSDDETYRTLLSTVASLGSSADASKTGRMALVVAGASLMVATVTLLVTEAGTHSLWSALLKLIG